MTRGQGSRKKGGLSGASPGCLLVLAALVAVLLLFLLNLGRIRQTLVSTNFDNIVHTQRGAEPSKGAPAAPAAPAPKAGEAAQSGAKGQSGGTGTGAATSPGSPPSTGQQPGGAASQGAQNPPAAAVQPAAASSGAAAGQSGAAAGTQTGAQAVAAPSGSQAVKPREPAAAAKTRPTSLFFVRIDDDGVIVRKEVKRNLAVSDAPLTDALAALLRGPTEDELREKLISLVPQGTKLLGVEVRGSTAYVNFNESFMYNHYGIEGYAGQLKQIVYTATSFPTVQDVQILIDGERHDYLGGEGVYIGKPLSRNSF